MQQSTGYVTMADGVRLHYVLQGESAPTVIVPNAVYMVDDLPSLSANRSVLFYDLRNRGRSDAVNDPRQLQRGVHHDVEDLAAIRSHFGIGAASVVAHSYTCMIAALHAMQYPEQVGRLLLIAPPPPDMKAPIPEQLRFADATGPQMMAKLQVLQQQPAADPVQRCREAWDIMRPFYVGRPEDVAKINHWGCCELANERGMLQHWQQNILPSLQALSLTSDDYAKVHMPVLIVHGTRDRSAPYGGGLAWARCLAHARLLTIDGAGHAPHLESQQRVLPAITAFLSGHWPVEAERAPP